MKIQIVCQQPKKEDKYLKPFAEFYLSSYLPKIKEVDIDCPDKNNQQKLPDYFLIQPKILVEIKEVHDREELEASAAWGYNIRRLENELKSRNLKGIKGSYLINTPPVVKIKQGNEGVVVNKLLNAVINNRSTINIADIGEFEIHKIGEQGNYVGFGLVGPAKWINPPGTIHQNIGPKIGTADKQLGSFRGQRVNKKILLLVNKYIFGEDPKEFAEALSYSYSDLLNYENIDEIWLQFETRDGNFLHVQLYTYDFLNSFDEKRVKVKDKIHQELFEKWFRPLEKLGDEQKGKLFVALKQFIKNKKPHHLFSDKFVREEMVGLGIWLAEKERFDDAIWFIDRFIDDPDPEKPEKYSGDPKFNYHQQIIDGEDPHLITTVLGHLAWVVQKLAVRKSYIEQGLNYTKKLLFHNNLYVILQAIIPLTEIAARRQWLDGWGKRPRKSKYKEFHKLVFHLVKLVQENPNYKAIAKWLSHVFAYYKDLSTKEAERVLDALKITDESAAVFVYLGIFRQRHYEDQPIKFNGRRLEKKLKEMIRNNAEDYRRVRASITWHFWKILDENRNEFETIKPYIDLTLEQPYQRDIYDDIERIIKDWIKDKPEVCIQWYKLILSKVSDFSKNEEKLRAQGGLWLMSTEEIIEVVTKINPDDLLECMKSLVEVWKKGGFIGSPKRLFESWRLISDQEKQREVKKQLKQWYSSMKKLNPKIEKVNWD